MTDTQAASRERFDAAWKAIHADPELSNARRVLSVHEIRKMVGHVANAFTQRLEEMRKLYYVDLLSAVNSTPGVPEMLCRFDKDGKETGQQPRDVVAHVNRILDLAVEEVRVSVGKMSHGPLLTNTIERIEEAKAALSALPQPERRKNGPVFGDIVRYNTGCGIISEDERRKPQHHPVMGEDEAVKILRDKLLYDGWEHDTFDARLRSAYRALSANFIKSDDARVRELAEGVLALAAELDAIAPYLDNHNMTPPHWPVKKIADAVTLAKALTPHAKG